MYNIKKKKNIIHLSNNTPINYNNMEKERKKYTISYYIKWHESQINNTFKPIILTNICRKTLNIILYNLILIIIRQLDTQN